MMNCKHGYVIRTFLEYRLDKNWANTEPRVILLMHILIKLIEYMQKKKKNI